jgi:hypothetical protein
MSESPLNTQAGPIAVIAGGLYALVRVGQFAVMDRSDLAAMVENPAFQVFSIAYFMTFPLLVIALVALYWRQASQTGLFGAVAFCVAVTGTVALAGDMWFEGFATPWLIPLAPAILDAEKDGLLLAGFYVSVVLFSLGWVLFGLASLRSRLLPRTLSIAVAVGGVIGFLAAMPPWGVVLGLAVAATGVWLIRHDRNLRRNLADPLTKPVAAGHH